MSEYGFGIDGGGSRSRLRVFNWATGEEVCLLTGSSTNLYSVGRRQAQENTLELLTRAGLPLDAYRGGCIGSAGLSRPSESRLFSSFLAEHLPGCPVHLCNDGEILLVGSLKCYSGYCLIAGTGSLALGRAEDGRTVRSGGLGYMLGDEGSALWISWQAIMRSLRSAEGRDIQTSLLPMLLEHFSLTSADDFVALMHERFKKSEIAGAAESILREADRDPLAHDILLSAVKELTLLVCSVADRLPMHPMQLALSGGVLENNAQIRSLLTDSLRERYPEMEFVIGKGSAVLGACMLAKEHR